MAGSRRKKNKEKKEKEKLKKKLKKEEEEDELDADVRALLNRFFFHFSLLCGNENRQDTSLETEKQKQMK